MYILIIYKPKNIIWSMARTVIMAFQKMCLHNLFFLMFQWRKFNFFDIIHDADSKKISQTIGVCNFD